jgi:N-acetylglucosamine kinase-like BadF-type ATPase
MILVADSGSTKTDWVLIHEGASKEKFSTIGFNPQFHNSTFIVNALKKNKGLKNVAREVKKVYFYGAGCSSSTRNRIVKVALNSIFKSALVKVDHDVLGSALATCGDEEGISCILGTGSNSCYYDGKKIHKNNFGLGFIMGDEGSGSYYGKTLIRHYLYGILPGDLRKKFDTEYTMDKEVMLRHVYNNRTANVWLASFARFLSANKNHRWVKEQVNKGMKEFLEMCVSHYPRYKKMPVHFVGSIAYLYRDQLRSVAAEMGITIGKIIQQPIDDLAEYHLES